MSLEQQYTAILGQLGEDVSREGLLDTPKRAAKAMQYLCRGYQQTLEEVTNGALYWAGNGVQDRQMRNLKLGQIPFDGSLYLHGMSVEKASETLWEFLAEATKLEIRCVRVTHGKAVRMDGRKPMIKSHVNTWLRQHPQVLGFSSCLAKHGGTGAVYIILKRTMMDGRDE